MKFKTALSLGVALTGALAISACGGGGDSGPYVPTPLQQSVSDVLNNGGSHNISASLSATDAKQRYIISLKSSLPAPMFVLPQQIAQQLQSLSAGLLQASSGSLPVNRALVDGKVVILPEYEKSNQWIYPDGDQVVVETRATDGVAVYSKSRYLGYEVVPVTGLVSAAPADVTQSPDMADLFRPTPENVSPLKADASFLQGAAYIKRTAKREGDLVYLQDCSGKPTRDLVLTYCAPASLERAFPYTHGGVTYQFTDGKMQTIQGQRAWVAKAKMPEAVQPTDTYLLLVELEGRVYLGGVQRHGTTVRTRQADGTVVDHSVRLNQKAFDSLKAAVNL